MSVRRLTTAQATKGDIIGTFGERFGDPFERLPNGLLLVEDFGRLELSRPRQLRSWIQANGAFALAEFYRDDALGGPGSGPVGLRLGFQDHWSHVWREQTTVRGLLLAMVELSAGRSVTFVPNGETDESLETLRSIATITGHGAGSELGEALRSQAFVIGWYVERALAVSYEVAWGVKGNPLGLELRRKWESVLAPMYLQLFEALRRISEGRPGANRCRECGFPFLVLDARRTAYCSAGHGNRYRQRLLRGGRHPMPDMPRWSALGLVSNLSTRCGRARTVCSLGNGKTQVPVAMRKYPLVAAEKYPPLD